MHLPCYPGMSRRPRFGVVAALTLTASLFAKMRFSIPTASNSVSLEAHTKLVTSRTI